MSLPSPSWTVSEPGVSGVVGKEEKIGIMTLLSIAIDANSIPSNGCPIYLIILLIPDVILTVGLIIAWYVRWTFFAYTSLLVIGIFSILVITLNAVCTLYYKKNCVSVLSHFAIGSLLCVASMLESPDLSGFHHSEYISSIFLLMGLLCHVVVTVFLKLCTSYCKSKSFNKSLLNYQELAELIGASVSLFVIGSESVLPLQILLMALAVALQALKLKSYTSLFIMAFLCITAEVYTFPQIHLSVNPYGIICFIGRLAAAPVIDLCDMGITRMGRWANFIVSRKMWHKVVFILILAFEVQFVVIHSASIGSHKEWYIVIPVYCFASLFWFMTHIVFIMVWWTLITRFGQSSAYNSGSLLPQSSEGDALPLEQLKRFLASKGLRYFSLVAKRLLYASVLSTCIIHVLCWTTRGPYSFSTCAIVFCVEVLTLELLDELCISLGGTSIGFGIVAPVMDIRSDGMVSVLPPGFMQESGVKSTQIINSLVQFFTNHMVTNFGCDWTMGGITVEDVENKLRLFFAQTTYEGPRYDTYILYYSGPVGNDGEWALANETMFPLERLLCIWDEACFSTESKSHKAGTLSSKPRLILVLDTAKSFVWLKKIRRQRGDIVGLQTFHSGDYKNGQSPGRGTNAWVEYNNAATTFSGTEKDALFKNAGVRPVYGVSRNWTDFEFHLPCPEEVKAYWLDCFPRISHPLMTTVIRVFSARFSCLPYRCVARVCKRARMRFWPPTEWDTGHGFNLVSM